MPVDIDHLPQQLSSDCTPWTLYPEQAFDYAGGSYHMNDEQHGYQVCP